MWPEIVVLAPPALKDTPFRELIASNMFKAGIDQGRGVSPGLQYEPGIFATLKELEAVARLERKKTNYSRCMQSPFRPSRGPALSSNSCGRAHNLLAIEDM